MLVVGWLFAPPEPASTLAVPARFHACRAGLGVRRATCIMLPIHLALGCSPPYIYTAPPQRKDKDRGQGANANGLWQAATLQRLEVSTWTSVDYHSGDASESILISIMVGTEFGKS